MITMKMMITITTVQLYILTTVMDYRMLKGITIMMIVLLMKACIESSQDIGFVFFPLSVWIFMEGIYNNYGIGLLHAQGYYDDNDR